MNYECRIIEVGNQPVLAIRTITAVENLPAFFGEAYGSIMKYLGELGGQPVGMCNIDMKALDVEAGFPVARSLPEREKWNPVKLLLENSGSPCTLEVMIPSVLLMKL